MSNYYLDVLSRLYLYANFKEIQHRMSFWDLGVIEGIMLCVIWHWLDQSMWIAKSYHGGITSHHLLSSPWEYTSISNHLQDTRLASSLVSNHHLQVCACVVCGSSC